MASMIVGLFDHKTSKVDLERDFENLGFSNDDYVIYVNDNANEFFVSTNINSENSNNNAISLFKKYQVLKTFNFENLSGPLPFSELKKIIDLNAKAEVPNIDSIIFKQGNEGINNEVAF